jgi:hypothetical protein
MPAITLGAQPPRSLVTTKAPDAPREEPLEPAVEAAPAPELEALLGDLVVALGAEPGQPSEAMDYAKQYMADAASWVKEHRRRLAAGEEAYPAPEDPEAPPAPTGGRKQN